MKVYRGYNKDYPNLGVRPEQNHIWATDDLEYAFEYAKLFENGGVIELELDDNKIKSANQYDYANIIDDEFGGDPIDADNSTCQKIIDEGYNFLIFDDMDKDIYLILDKSIIINVKEIDVIENQINEVLRLAGVQLNESINENFTKERFEQLVELLICGANESENVWNVITYNELYSFLDSNPKIKEAVKKFLYSVYGNNEIDIREHIDDKLRHNRYPNNNDYVYKLLYQLVYKKMAQAVAKLIAEFEKENTLYREIFSNKSPKELIEYCKEEGLGNCWTNNINAAYSYEGGVQKYQYLFEAYCDIKSVDWIMTAYLRTIAPHEEEIRLKRNAIIKLKSIKYNVYEEDETGDHQIVNSETINLNGETFKVGVQFSYDNYNYKQ